LLEIQMTASRKRRSAPLGPRHVSRAIAGAMALHSASEKKARVFPTRIRYSLLNGCQVFAFVLCTCRVISESWYAHTRSSRDHDRRTPRCADRESYHARPQRV